jgi:4-amino-4-deoxy-L-arabinose transferase-like glycosyltransferase
MDGGDARRTKTGVTLFWVVLAVVTLGGLALRLGHIAVDRWDLVPSGDARYYHDTANFVADGHGIINPFLYEDGVELAAADHPPLYTAYLSFFSLFGLRTANQHIIVSALLGTATIVLAGLIGRQLGGDRIGLLAAVFAAVYPNVWRHDAMLMSETIAVFCTALTVWLAYRYLARPTAVNIVLVGAAIGLATLARSELILLAPFIVVPSLLVTSDRSRAERLRWLGLAAVACVVIVAPWVIRNWVQLDRPMLSSQLEVTLAAANCDSTYYGEMVGYWDLNCVGPILEQAAVDDPTDDGFDHVLGEAAQQYVKDNLSRTPEVMAIRLGRNLTIYEPDQQVDLDRFVEANTTWVAHASLWSFRVMALLGIAGAIVLRRRRVTMFPVLAPIGVVVITVVLLYSSGRFRAPADLMLAILAAVAIDALCNVVAHRVGRDHGEAGAAPDDVVEAPTTAPTPTPT